MATHPAADATHPAPPTRHAAADGVCLTRGRMEVFAAPVDAGGENKPPRFRGTLYSGGLAQPWGGPIVIDLETLRLPGKSKPAFVMHAEGMMGGFFCGGTAFDPDHRQIVGGITSFEVVEAEGGRLALRIEGQFNDSKWARVIASDLALETPWELSGCFEPGTLVEVAQGDEVVVNGETFAGPLRVMRNATVREGSYVPLGADPDTDVEMFQRRAAAAANERNNQMGLLSKKKGNNDDSAKLQAVEPADITADWLAEQVAAGVIDAAVVTDAATRIESDGDDGSTEDTPTTDPPTDPPTEQAADTTDDDKKVDNADGEMPEKEKQAASIADLEALGGSAEFTLAAAKANLTLDAAKVMLGAQGKAQRSERLRNDASGAGAVGLSEKAGQSASNEPLSAWPGTEGMTAEQVWDHCEACRKLFRNHKTAYFRWARGEQRAGRPINVPYTRSN